MLCMKYFTYFSHVLFTVYLEVAYYNYSYFPIEEFEAQRGKVTFLRSIRVAHSDPLINPCAVRNYTLEDRGALASPEPNYGALWDSSQPAPLLSPTESQPQGEELWLSLLLPTFPRFVPSLALGPEFPRQSQPHSLGWSPSLFKKRKMLLWRLQQLHETERRCINAGPQECSSTSELPVGSLLSYAWSWQALGLRSQAKPLGDIAPPLLPALGTYGGDQRGLLPASYALQS